MPRQLWDAGLLIPQRTADCNFNQFHDSIQPNGRFPTLFTLITLFFTAGLGGTFLGSFTAALCLTAVILLGVLAALASSWVLSHTLLKGIPSFFTLELPPYRRPQIGKVVVRSIFDRTLFVLGRAVAVAAPAGLLIWALANISYVGDRNGYFALTAQTALMDASNLAVQTVPPSSPALLSILTGFFDPLGRVHGNGRRYFNRFPVRLSGQ